MPFGSVEEGLGRCAIAPRRIWLDTLMHVPPNARSLRTRALWDNPLTIISHCG
ncbi:hypothetical protein LX36DRAFT_651078 [Colletotrichum falcatum]|nr:hypothetical protein LX36DRAFT_651078 [Colletotrichum falcatum]